LRRMFCDDTIPRNFDTSLIGCRERKEYIQAIQANSGFLCSLFPFPTFWLFVCQCFVWLYHRKKCLDFCEWAAGNSNNSTAPILLWASVLRTLTEWPSFSAFLNFPLSLSHHYDLGNFIRINYLCVVLGIGIPRVWLGTIHPDVGLSQLLNLYLNQNQLD
jgi:hypothetical protein